jgi:hypothetical protein
MIEPFAIAFGRMLFRKAIKLPGLAGFFKAEIFASRHLAILLLFAASHHLQETIMLQWR